MHQFLPFTDFEDVALRGVPFAAIAFVACLVDLVVVLRVALRPGPIGLRRALECAAAGVLLTALRTAALLPYGLSPFGVLAFAWYDLCLVVPITATCVLAAARRGRAVGGAARAAAWLGVASIAVTAWMHWIEPRRLVVETVRIEVPAAREGAQDVRIAVLADLQCDAVGAFERETVDAVCALRPDLVLVPGDLFHGSPAQYRRARPELVRLLTRLAACAPTWLVYGDTDHVEDYAALARDADCGLLANERASLRVRDRVIGLYGVLPFHESLGRWELRPQHDPARHDWAFVRTTEGDASTADVRVVLAHHGDVAGVLSTRSRVDLVVAGHTHGGQVQLPWFGPPITASALPRDVAAGGLFWLWGKTWLYQCRGTGLERVQAPRIRFLCPPTIGLVIVADARDEAA